MSVNIVFKPHNICQVWTNQQSSLQRIQSMKSYKGDMGTAKFDIVHHFAYINSSFQEICSLVTHYAAWELFPHNPVFLSENVPNPLIKASTFNPQPKGWRPGYQQHQHCVERNRVFIIMSIIHKVIMMMGWR